MTDHQHPYVAADVETAALFQLTMERLGYEFQMRTQLLDFGVLMDVTFWCSGATPEDLDARFNETLGNIQAELSAGTNPDLTVRYNAVDNHYRYGLM